MPRSAPSSAGKERILDASLDLAAPLAARPRSTGSARFLAATGISFYGDWLTTVALVVLLFRTTGSATGPALYMVSRVAPRVFGPTPGGVLADRFGPARIASICLLSQGVLTASIVGLGNIGLIWAIYPVVAGAQFVNALSQPAYGAMLPRVTAPQNLGRLNGLYSGLFASSILVSPAIGALLLPHMTPQVLIAADSLTFLVAALLIATLPVKAAPADEQTSPRGARAGWRVVSTDATLRSATAAVLGNAAVVTALQAVLVVAASQHFSHDTNVGWLYASVGAGSLVGSLAFLRPNPRRIRRRNIVACAAAELAALAFFVFASNLPIACTLLFLSSLTAVFYQILGAIALQQRVPVDLLGRASGVTRLAMYVGMLAGAVAALALVGPFGWEVTVLAVCVAALVFLGLATFTGPRDHRALTPLSDIPD